MKNAVTRGKTATNNVSSSQKFGYELDFSGTSVILMGLKCHRAGCKQSRGLLEQVGNSTLCQ